MKALAFQVKSSIQDWIHTEAKFFHKEKTRIPFIFWAGSSAELDVILRVVLEAQ